ncbi:MAG TPA: DivIVA domain-containing protein [Streptosporangiaceae bacterium]|jgi:DivIVA domain-containing protein
MTGDEIRGTQFPRCFRGYDPCQVGGCLLGLAALIDAGRSPGPYISFIREARFSRVVRGYDPEAVDQFLKNLEYPQPQLPEDSWQAASGRAVRWDGSGGPDCDRTASGSGARGELWKAYVKECDAGWLRVADLPGTRLRMQWSWTGATKILDSTGEVLMTCNRTWTLGPSGQVFRSYRGQVSDAGTGEPILQTIGAHRYHYDGTVMVLPGGRLLRFPVQSSRNRNAVMTGVDESDAEVLWFRIVRKLPATLEVVVSPESDLTPETLCVIALAAPLLAAYLKVPGGGG